MNIQLDFILAVILNLYECSEKKSLASASLLAIKNNSEYSFTKRKYRERGYGSTSLSSFMSVSFLRGVQCSWK